MSNQQDIKGLYSRFPIFGCKHIAYSPSWHCNNRCRHCLLPIEHRKSDRFSSKVFEELMEVLNRFASGIEITGGEPFEHPVRLVRLVRDFRSTGLHVAVVTGGRWLQEWPEASRLIERLSSAGLGFLSISLDEYHIPKLERKQIGRLLSFTKDIGIGVGISATGAWAKSEIRAMLEEGFIENSLVGSRRGALERVGLATRLDEDMTGSHEVVDNCPSLSMPLVFPTGEVVSCCSARLLNFNNSEMNLGNILSEKLPDIIYRHRCNLLVGAIFAFGPFRLYEIIGEEPPRNCTKCHACVEFMNNPLRLELLRNKIGNDREIKKMIFGRSLLLQGDYAKIDE